MVDMIITKYGWAAFKATSTRVRAEKVIFIAHPDFRDELIREAQKMKIWRHPIRFPGKPNQANKRIKLILGEQN